MKSQLSKILPVVFTVGLIFLMASSSLLAAGNPGTSPETALVPDGEWKPLEAGEYAWYQFDYAGNRSQILIQVYAAPLTGAEFSVWTPTQMAAGGMDAGLQPIGRGSTDPNFGGQLIWTGNFNTAGTYYLRVSNQRAETLGYMVKVSGSGVSLPVVVEEEEVVDEPAPEDTPAPEVVEEPEPEETPSPEAVEEPEAEDTPEPEAVEEPAPEDTTAPEVIEEEVEEVAEPEDTLPPAEILTPDGSWWTLEPGARHTYAFEYAGNRSQIEIVLRGYPISGVGFSVWTPAQLERGGAAAGLQPIGRGSYTPMKGGVLLWTGNFSTAGTYHVTVDHLERGSVGYMLEISGSGVWYGTADVEQEDEEEEAAEES